MKRILAGLPLLFSVTNLLAQTASPDDAVATATATPALSTAGLIGAGVCGIIPCIFGVALWLGIGIWVMRDAKRRNSPNATLVTVLAWLPPTSVIGLIVHLITRPKTVAESTYNPPSNPPPPPTV